MKLLSFNIFSPESKVKKIIRENLKVTLDDFKSYIPVEFGDLEEEKTKYEDLWAYKYGLEQVDIFLKVANENTEKSKHCSSSSQTKECLEKSSKALDSVRFHLNQVEYKKLKFVPQFIGWKMKHTFNSKNQKGIYEIHYYEFLFDKELTKIIKSVEIFKK